MSSGSSVEDQPVSIGAGEGYLKDYYEHLSSLFFTQYDSVVCLVFAKLRTKKNLLSSWRSIMLYVLQRPLTCLVHYFVRS